MPIKARTRISLATRGDITVTDHIFNHVALTQPGQQSIERPVLGIIEWKPIAALKLDADGKVVAVLPTQPTGNTGVPGATGAGNELDQLSVATDKEMGRDP